MADYIPPTIDNIFFEFTSKGYEKPAFDDIVFNFSSQQLGDLQAAISVTQLYIDTTYTYTKECRKVVVGYNDSGVQVIDLPCLFGGIRDIMADIVCKNRYVSSYKDFYTHIRSTKQETLDIFTFVRAYSTANSDLTSYSHAWYKGDSSIVAASRAERKGVLSFSSFVRQSWRSSADILGYTKFVRGHAVISDLIANIIDIQPVNMAALLNIIELRELPSLIEGVYFKGSSDFYIEFNKVQFRSNAYISSNIFGWATSDLSSRIVSFWTKDLNVHILAGFFAIHKNLSSLIFCITPKNLGATLHGYDTLNLNAFTILGFTPNDLQAFISTIKYENLLAYINGKYGVNTYLNLPAFIHGVHIRDIVSYINTIEAKNLTATIDAVGKYIDLLAKIAPRTVNIKRMLFIPLMEHKDLKATIQYSCKGSSFSDFYTEIYAIRMKDLKAHIIGWFSGTADNVRDLAAYINYNDYSVQNYITVSGYAQNKDSVLFPLVLNKKQEYRVQNYIGIAGGNSQNLLAAYIVGQLQYANLNAYIRSVPLANFTTIPSWVNPSTLEAVINLERFEERWTRFVEMLFFTNSVEDFHYFYVSGENKIYKVDKKRTWKISVTGYSQNYDTIYERTRINKKFIFNLSNYNSVDEAIKDLIDRVTLPRSLNLPATLYAYDYDNRDLFANINVKQRISWSRALSTNIVGKSSSQIDCVVSIQPTLYKDINNLTGLIVGKAYEAPEPSNITFTFKEPGYIPAPYYNNMDWTYKQAEVFWKED